MEERENLESSLLRHGEIEIFGKMIEKGEKPSYEDFIKFIEGEIDPPIDKEATREVIEKRIEQGKINKEDFDIIICSPTLRAEQTAKLIREVLGVDLTIRPSKYLREIHFPIDDITPEFYEKAKDIYEVRKKFLDSFLNGKKIDEDVVEVYRRAERFLTYFRRIRKSTSKKPLFVSHGHFARFLNLAADHQGEELNDDEIRGLVLKEFAQTARPGTLEGFRMVDTKEGAKIVGII